MATLEMFQDCTLPLEDDGFDDTTDCQVSCSGESCAACQPAHTRLSPLACSSIAPYPCRSDTL